MFEHLIQFYGWLTTRRYCKKLKNGNYLINGITFTEDEVRQRGEQELQRKQ